MTYRILFLNLKLTSYKMFIFIGHIKRARLNNVLVIYYSFYVDDDFRLMALRTGVVFEDLLILLP